VVVDVVGATLDRAAECRMPVCLDRPLFYWGCTTAYGLCLDPLLLQSPAVVVMIGDCAVEVGLKVCETRRRVVRSRLDRAARPAKGARSRHGVDDCNPLGYLELICPDDT